MKLLANQFAEKTPRLTLHCISHKTLRNHKADAFVFEYCGELYLIDGGIYEATYVFDYLLAIRKRFLRDHAALVDDPSCKLRVNWIISHYHSDHVGAVIEKMIPNPFFELGDVYSPPDSEIAEIYQMKDRDGDYNMRPLLKAALSKLTAPAYTVHDIGFGVENRFTVSTQSGIGREVKFTFLPPPFDFGEKWYMDYTVDLYQTKTGGLERLPVTTVNSASVWVLAEFAGKKILFTGDTTKREKHMYSEGLDFMMEAYADEIGKLDVLKYVHHGYARNHALPAMMSFAPEILLVSKTDSPIPELVEKRYPDTSTKVMNVADETLVITCGYDEVTGEPLPLAYEWHEEIVK